MSQLGCVQYRCRCIRVKLSPCSVNTVLINDHLNSFHTSYPRTLSWTNKHNVSVHSVHWAAHSACRPGDPTLPFHHHTKLCWYVWPQRLHVKYHTDEQDLDANSARTHHSKWILERRWVWAGLVPTAVRPRACRHALQPLSVRQVCSTATSRASIHRVSIACGGLIRIE